MLVKDFPVGSIIEGAVTKLVPFGVFVELGDGVEGLVHISEMAKGHVETPDQVTAVGTRSWSRSWTSTSSVAASRFRCAPLPETLGTLEIAGATESDEDEATEAAEACRRRGLSPSRGRRGSAVEVRSSPRSRRKPLSRRGRRRGGVEAAAGRGRRRWRRKKPRPSKASSLQLPEPRTPTGFSAPSFSRVLRLSGGLRCPCVVGMKHGVVVITGGIGAGKSTAAEFLREKGAVVISGGSCRRAGDEQRLAHACASAFEEFGPGILTAIGSSIAPRSPGPLSARRSARASLNEIVHPSGRARDRTVDRRSAAAARATRGRHPRGAAACRGAGVRRTRRRRACDRRSGADRVARAVGAGFEEEDARNRADGRRATPTCCARRRRLVNDANLDRFLGELELFWIGRWRWVVAPRRSGVRSRSGSRSWWRSAAWDFWRCSSRAGRRSGSGSTIRCTTRADCGSAKRHAISPYLVSAVVDTESGWKADRVSAAGAVGLMQIMPQTARDLAGSGLVDRRKFPPSSLKDPTVNIEYGTAYLRFLVNRYHEIETALAAYNAGLRHADTWKKKGGDIKAAIAFPETRKYVQNVQQARARYQSLYPRASLGATSLTGHRFHVVSPFEPAATSRRRSPSSRRGLRTAFATRRFSA